MDIQPEYSGLTINPCVPADWKSFKMTRRFRGNQLNIEVTNESGVQKGVSKLIVNGEEIVGNFIPIEKLKEQNEVSVIMG